jgi:hypothetical protein
MTKTQEIESLRMQGYTVAPSKSKAGTFRWWRETGSDGVSVPRRELSDTTYNTEADAWDAAKADSDIVFGVQTMEQAVAPREMSNYIDPVDQKTGLDANVPPASKRQSSIKVPIVFGKNRTRGNSVGAMIDDMYGEHAVLRDLLSREARGVGIDPSTEYVTQGVSRVLRLYEEAHDAWLKSKGDTVGHVLEVELPSGQKLLMGSRQTLYGYELSPAQERSQYDCPSP